MLDPLINFLTLEIIIIAILTATTTTLPGVLLALQKKALLSDAVAHSVLLGIVLSFLFVQTLDSPLLFAGATLSGVLAVLLTETLLRTPFLKTDSAMVIVFSFCFSLAFILINVLSAENVHLDEDAVILGELAFTPFVRTESFLGLSVPTSLIRAGILLIIEFLFIIFFYKELISTSFDPHFMQTQGFSKRRMELALVWIASLSAANAMETLGTFVTIAFFVLPAAAGLLWGRTVKMVYALSGLFILITLPLGYLLSYSLHVSINGSMAFSMAILLLVLIFLKVVIRGSRPSSLSST